MRIALARAASFLASGVFSYNWFSAVVASRLISAAVAARAGRGFSEGVTARVSASRQATSRAFNIVRAPLVGSNDVLKGVLADLLGERDAARELVIHERSGLVLDLIQLRDLLRRQDLLEAREIRRQDRNVIALESQVLLEQAGRRVVAQRIVILGVGLDQLQEPIVVVHHVALVGVVDGPKGLALTLGEIEHGGHHGPLVVP